MERTTRIEAKRAEPLARRDALQPLLVLAPPVIWMLQQQLSYALTPSACAARSEWWLHALSALAALAVAAITFLAWGELRRLPPESSEHSRRRFLAGAGIGSGALFLLVIVATELPSWVLGACVR